MISNSKDTDVNLYWCPLMRVSLMPWVAMFERCRIEEGGEYWNFALFCESISPHGVYRLEALDIDSVEVMQDVLRDSLNQCRIPFAETDVQSAIGTDGVKLYKEGQEND